MKNLKKLERRADEGPRRTEDERKRNLTRTAHQLPDTYSVLHESIHGVLKRHRSCCLDNPEEVNKVALALLAELSEKLLDL